MRTYAIGDLHGRADLLQLALEWASEDAAGQECLFLCLGDMIDRGPDSAGVVRLMRQSSYGSLTLKALQGNHEDFMVMATLGRDRHTVGLWRENGGEQTIRSYTGATKSKGNNIYHRITAQWRDDAAWLHGLDLFHMDQHRFYVHAGVRHSEGMEQTKEDLQWIRLIGTEEYPPFLGRHLVHGHEQYASGPILTKNRTNLDTFAWLHGRLTVAVFEDDVPGGPARTHDVTGPMDPSMDCWGTV